MSYDLNEVNLIGRITSDLELKQTPNGNEVSSFSIATNKSYTDQAGIKQEKAEFHNIVTWGKLAEIITQYGSKGQRVFIKGELQTRSWEAQDGTKRYKVEIRASNIILLDGKKKDSNDDVDWNEVDKGNVKKTTPKKEKLEEISIEDIPF